MSFTRALIVMTPPMAARLGAEAEAIVDTVRAGFERSVALLSDDPRALHGQIVEFDPELIVAAGGDGTVNLVVQAMREQDTLAVIPLGTANDLARALGLARDASSLERPAEQSVRRIDCLRVNGQRFCTTGGLGLPAEVARRVNLLRGSGRRGWADTLGRRIYPLVAAQLCVCPPPRHRLQVSWEPLDGDERAQLEVDSYGVFVTNQASFAGDLSVVADARNDDGRFELCIMLARGRCELLCLLGHSVQHRLREGECRIIRTRRARILADRELRFFGDGEVLCKAREFELEIEAAALRVLAR